jgi:hypothetical protein
MDEQVRIPDRRSRWHHADDLDTRDHDLGYPRAHCETRGRDTDLHDHWPKALRMDSCGFGRSSPKNSAISGRSAWQPIQKEVRTTGDDV